jgi:RNA polymerase sigma-70 factor (ECF subfamily)
MHGDFDAQVAELRDKLVASARSLLRRYRGPAIPLDAHDLAQRVLLAAARLEELLQQLGEERMARYLTKILKHEFADAVREHAQEKRDVARQRPLLAAHTKSLSDQRPSPAEQAERNELLDRAKSVLPALPPAQREVVSAHFFEGLSLADVAARRGCARATVTIRFRQGMANLKERLGLDG